MRLIFNCCFMIDVVVVVEIGVDVLFLDFDGMLIIGEYVVCGVDWLIVNYVDCFVVIINNFSDLFEIIV